MASLSRARLFFHAVRYLRLGQIGWRLWYLVYRPRADTTLPPPIRAVTGSWTRWIAREPSLLDSDTVRFLNQKARIDKPAVWNDPRFEKLWLYNLHYFDDLNAREAAKRTDWHRVLIGRWIAENPPGYGNGWEPYPTSLRIVNWIKWSIAGHEPCESMHHSLAIQARWLRRSLEYHILGNHLLANAKALVFAGLYFEGPEAERWYRKGLQILSREIPEQVLPDGGHFERSPMYHLLVLEDLLDLINLHRAYDASVPALWRDAVASMLAWSRVMRHPDGGIPFFNDAAFEVAPEPGVVDSYAERLDFKQPGSSSAGITHLQYSGHARLATRRAILFTDMAPIGPDYLPGHAHADTLSFELSLDGMRVIVNGGTSIYGISDERERQRSTASHSTLVIDGVDSTEVWSGFRAARRARILFSAAGEKADALWAEAAHDGYRRLSGRPTHHRRWALHPQELVIRDQVEGAGEHLLEAVFPLHPAIRPKLSDGNDIELVDARVNGPVLSFNADSKTRLIIEPTTWHPRFGLSKRAWRIRCLFTASLPTTISYRFDLNPDQNA